MYIYQLIIQKEGHGVNSAGEIMPEILIRAGEREKRVSAQPGERLLDVLRRAGVLVPAPCGGLGKCGKCRAELDGESILCCRTRVTGDCTVRIEELQGGVILAGEGESPAVPGKAGAALGAALDLGTTTLALKLYDLSTGACLGQQTAWNAQAAYGADVITRAQYCMEHPAGTEKLQRVIREQLGDMLRALGTGEDALTSLFVAGNTVMQHLFAGLDPSSIARAPFRAQTLFDAPDTGSVHYAPCVAGYVGGDITAGLLASGLYEKPGRRLFLDIGTNGEMALGGKDGFLCCAVASGPAFEGAGISCGMTGTAGAVSHVREENGALRLEVIGGGEARGICGSGLLDLAALLCREGVITGSGLLLPPEEAPEKWAAYLGMDEDLNGVFYLTPDRRVYLTARDVRQLQLAKAAVAAGIRVLLKKSGTDVTVLDGLCIAGGFGSFLDPKSAAAIGMLPAELADKTVTLGNASLAGAGMALLDPAARARLCEIQKSCDYIELSGDPDFNEEYPEQLSFYEEDEDEWN